MLKCKAEQEWNLLIANNLFHQNTSLLSHHTVKYYKELFNSYIIRRTYTPGNKEIAQLP